jgi:hypothetical protein
MIQAITILTLSVLVIILFTRLERQEDKIQTLSDALKIVDDLFARHEDAMNEFDHRLTETRRTITADEWKRICRELEELKVWMEKAEDIIEAHAELEKEAAKSEQLFQEGLTNLLNYGVIKHE